MNVDIKKWYHTHESDHCFLFVGYDGRVYLFCPDGAITAFCLIHSSEGCVEAASGNATNMIKNKERGCKVGSQQCVYVYILVSSKCLVRSSFSLFVANLEHYELVQNLFPSLLIKQSHDDAADMCPCYNSNYCNDGINFEELAPTEVRAGL